MFVLHNVKVAANIGPYQSTEAPKYCNLCQTAHVGSRLAQANPLFLQLQP